MKQLTFDFMPREYNRLADCDLHSYDHYIVATSGGKDSFACLAYLILNNVPRSKIELWHHCIDGKQGANGTRSFFDWPVTEDYTKRLGETFGIPVFYSWKRGGFHRELFRENSRTAPTHFECPDPEDNDNIIECSLGGLRGKLSTRLKFPQVSGNLLHRWCSSALKIDVCTMALNNQKRFLNKRTLVLSGERAEESPMRAKYKEFEKDRADNRNGKRINRHVDRLRPVHSWKVQKIWDAMREFKIVPHPCYRLGWGRLSCISCIFGSSSQWASLASFHPDLIDEIAEYEKRFSLTIDRKLSVWEKIERGMVYPGMDPDIIKLGMGSTYNSEIRTTNWQLPSGAFGENAGPI